MAYRRLHKLTEEKHNPWVIFNPHTLSPLLPMHDSMTICTIDPGIKNCAIRIAKRTGDQVSTILQDKVEFKSYTDTITYFGSIKDHLLNCHYIIVESQLRVNYDLIRMGQHIQSTLMVLVQNQGLRPLIIEVDPKLKSSYLGAPKFKSKKDLKKWASQMAISILESRSDSGTLKIITGAKKQDDHGDVICMEMMFWSILASGSIPIPNKIY